MEKISIKLVGDIPEGFPMGLSDEKLIKVNIALAENAMRPPHHGEPFQVWQQFAQMGQYEYSNRMQKRFVDETMELKDEISELKSDNENSNKWTRILSVLTVSLAVITLVTAFVTYRLASLDLASDESWQKMQKDLLLEQIRVEKEGNGKLDLIITGSATDAQAESNTPNNDK